MTIAVQLRRTVPDLGRAGDLVMVSQAYARNYLLPKGLAVLATPKVVADHQHQAAGRAAEQAKARVVEDQAKSKVAGATVRLTGRASSTGKLFASIKSDQVVAAIRSQLGVPLPSSTVLQPAVVKTLGDHPVALCLGDHTISFTVHIEHGEA